MSHQDDSLGRHSGVFDFFISYKQKDSADFARALRNALVASDVDVWLDEDAMVPGDSILNGIEDGIRSSVDAIVILSAHYFSGWSEQERRNLYSLMVSKKIRIVPIWHRLDREQVESLAPLFADIVAIQAPSGTEEEARGAAATILKRFNPKQRESRLYELFFQAVRKHVADPDLDLFLGVFAGDVQLVEAAVRAGGNVNITDAALWNRYNRIITTHDDISPAWRRLYLHLAASGKMGGGSQG